MLGHRPFYHRTIRKYVTLFGALFNDIYIVRETTDALKKERIKVPLNYAPKEKFITRLKSDPSLTKSVQTTLPRMSFEMLSMTYDMTRKQQSTIRHTATNLADPTTPRSQYVGIPYNFDFGLNLYVRNIEDGAQVVEQILAFFMPDYTIKAQLSEELDIIKNVPIVLTSVSENNQYDGTFEDGTRMISWDFQFTIRGYIFGPVSNSAIIMGVSANTADPNANVTGGIYVNLYQDVNNKPVQKVIVTGGTIEFRETERIREPNTGITGYVHTWVNTSNALYLTQTSGVLKANDHVWGVDTGAHWRVLSIETVNLRTSEIRIYQNPITANADTDYGYSTYITEYPNTL